MPHQGELAGAGEIADLETLAAGHQECRGGNIMFRGYGHEDCILEPAVEKADDGRIAGEDVARKGVDLINAKLHR